MKPSIGRIVHYNNFGIHLAAIITNVWSDVCVNLTIFNNDPYNGTENVFTKISVILGEPDYHGGWHWPEKVE